MVAGSADTSQASCFFQDMRPHRGRPCLGHNVKRMLSSRSNCLLLCLLCCLHLPLPCLPLALSLRLKAAVKRANASKDKAEAQFAQAQRTLEECRAKVDGACLAVLQATEELEAFRLEHRETSGTTVSCETQRNLVANTLAEKISAMVAQARNNKEELSNTQIASKISVELLTLIPHAPSGAGQKRSAEQQLGKEDAEDPGDQDGEMEASQSVLQVPGVPATVPEATASLQSLPVSQEKEKQRAAPY